MKVVQQAWCLTYFLEVGLGGIFLYLFADSSGASESNFVNLHMFGDGSACSRAVSAQDIDHSGGKAGFLNELGHVER